MTRIGQGACNIAMVKGRNSVAATSTIDIGRRLTLLLMGSVCAGVPVTGSAQTVRPSATPTVATEDGGTVRSIAVSGSQRIEPDTVRSYIRLRAGAAYTRETLDQALQDLFATELFADVQIRDDNGALTVVIRENPIVNRIVFEGNKRIKDEKLGKELKLAPRQIFTRSKVRAEVARIVELYRRQGRFAATVEPKMVTLDQNRVDVVYEISEGPKSKVRQINIIGNERFDDGRLRSEMVTKRSRIWRFFSSNDSYDADRLAYDQQKLRQFYLTNGYADFRVVSAVAELTPDKRDFIITYVVEEGDRYKFGDVSAESEIRDFKATTVKTLLPMQKGDWYNAKQVEDTVESLTQTAGLFGYAFAQIDPQFERDKETKMMTVTFRVADAPRVYVERIDINGNTLTQDKVVRREFRLAEGDPFNSIQVRRSQERIQSLGFFQEKLEITQKQGSAPDRIILEANVEEKSTGELQLSAGFSSLERFILNASIRQRNFRGKGQEVRASVNYSTYSKSVELGFTEPYLFDRNIAVGGDIYRRDLNSFNFNLNGDRNNTYQQTTTGAQLRFGVPITEFWSLAGRYTLNFDDVTLDRNTYYFDDDGDGTLETCDPFRAGRYLCDALGKRTTSSLGYSLVYSDLDNNIRPTRGQRFVFTQDFAGLGGDVRYLKSTIDASKYWRVLGGFTLSASAEGGFIKSFENERGPGIDKVRLTDRYFLGEPQMRGFDIRGVGPRVLRVPYKLDALGNVLLENGKPVLETDRNLIADDALGGRAYYQGRLELEIPLGAGARELGLRPSIFADVGAVFGLTRPITTTTTSPISREIYANGQRQCIGSDGEIVSLVAIGSACPTGAQPVLSVVANPFEEQFLGNSSRPRLSVGFGVNWRSPFGPFRIDIAKVLLKEPGDQTKTVTFNVGTQF
jgi:outer membrane protein insertion porin family